MIKKLLLPIVLFAAVAYSDSSVTKVEHNRYMYAVDINIKDKDAYNKILDALKKTVETNDHACLGLIIKTDAGIIKFEKGPNDSKWRKKYDKLKAEDVAMRKLHGGCERGLSMIGRHIDKEIRKKHGFPGHHGKKHKKDHDED